MTSFYLIPKKEFDRIRKSNLPEFTRFGLVADMCRANTLTAVKIAGSGHLGSSFSAMDLVVFLYEKIMNTAWLGLEHPDRDIYFSSKGHDVPGLYAVFHSLGILSQEKLLSLRRLGGLDGHPDVGTPGIESNSGSLGMGLSKGKGLALAKRMAGRKGRVFVLTGDGELQEGQVYEALGSAANHRLTNLIVIVDHNKVQSDKLVDEISGLGDLEKKVQAFGWEVRRCDGHDFEALDRVMRALVQVEDRPKLLVADTIKGRGVSFMEHPAAFSRGGGLYRWHAGAPDDESFQAGHNELVARINGRLAEAGLDPLDLEAITPPAKEKSGVSGEYVAEAYGKALIEIAAERRDLVVLDADLAADCRVREFELKFPERFLENGIAEQDMVSTAGGLARQGFLPVVNSFAAFLASRANEQIYTNACEKTKIIYVCHYAGLIPAGPGKSHQSVRDISLLGALPNIEIIQPGNAAETQMALRYLVKETDNNGVLRLNIGPSPRRIQLPDDYRLTRGKGVPLKEGTKGVLLAYGPVLLHEALLAGEILAARGLDFKVVNMPWLNVVDPEWLLETVRDCPNIFVVEDHSPVGGLADRLSSELWRAGAMDRVTLNVFGVEGFPACGTPQEALRFHGLDGESLARRVEVGMKGRGQ
ncbi:MAG: transketolase C-terminal domain-containing protein [Thermodesulfobacteriota bacterium]